jgi:hypothetical protein
MIDDSGKGATIALVEVSRVIDGEPRVRARSSNTSDRR